MYDLNINEFLTSNISNIDANDDRNLNYLSDIFFDLNENIEKQFNTTINTNDHTDYIKQVLSDDIFIQSINKDFIDKNLFFTYFINYIDDLFEKYFNLRLSDDFYNDDYVEHLDHSSIEDKFTYYYYNLYKSVVISQKLLTSMIYHAFYSISSAQLNSMKSLLNKDIVKNNKLKTRHTNYIFELDKIFTNKEELFNIILNTNIFTKNVEDSIRSYETNIAIIRLYNTFIKQMSKYDLVSLFDHVLTYDRNLTMLINQAQTSYVAP